KRWMLGIDSMVRTQVPCTELTSLVDLLSRRAAEGPDRPLFSFLPDGEPSGEVTLTRGELDAKARAIAVQLQELGLAHGDRALLLYPPGLEFIAAFFGCLYAGVLAVPAYLQRVSRPMPRLRSIVEDAGPAAFLTCAAQAKDAPRWEAGVPELRGVHRLVTNDEKWEINELARCWNDPAATPD